MESNARIMKAKYIEKTIDVRETFSFAHPEQILRALDIFTSDFMISVVPLPNQFSSHGTLQSN